MVLNPPDDTVITRHPLAAIALVRYTAVERAKALAGGCELSAEAVA